MWFSVILLELIVLSVIVYFIVKLIKKKDTSSNIETSVKEGVKSAIKELEIEKEVEEETIQKFKNDQKSAMGVFSSNDTTEEPINTTDLIPANLSERDKELLRMFYNQ